MMVKEFKNDTSTMPCASSRAATPPSEVKIIVKPLGSLLVLLGLTGLIVLSLLNYSNTPTQTATPHPSPSAPSTINRSFPPTSWRLDSELPGATLGPRSDPGAPGADTTVLHAEIRKGDRYRPYLVCAVNNDIPAMVTAAKLHLSVYGRSRTESTATLVLESRRPPYSKEINQTITLTPKWRKYEFDVAAAHDYASKEAQVRWILGAEAGEFDFAEMEMQITPPPSLAPSTDNASPLPAQKQ